MTDAVSPEETPESLLTRGDQLLRASQYGKARALFEQALDIEERAHGPDHPALVKPLMKLARVLIEQRSPARAVETYARLLTLCEYPLADDDLQSGWRLRPLFQMLKEMGERDRAVSLVEHIQGLLDRRHGPASILTAVALCRVANALYNGDDLVRAQQLYERALSIRESLSDPERAGTVSDALMTGLMMTERVAMEEMATNLHFLACVLRDQEEFAKAQPFAERALAIRERVCGPDHRATSLSLHTLAGIFYEQGHLAEALPLAERSLAIDVRVHGPRGAETTIVRHNLAKLKKELAAQRRKRPKTER